MIVAVAILGAFLAIATPGPRPSETVEARIHSEDNILIWRRIVLARQDRALAYGTAEVNWPLSNTTKAEDNLMALCEHGHLTGHNNEVGVQRGPLSYECMQIYLERGYTFDLKTNDMDKFNRLSTPRRTRILREIAHYVGLVYAERHPETPHAIVIRACDTLKGSTQACYERNDWALTMTFERP